MTAVAKVERPFGTLLDLEKSGALTPVALHLPELTFDRYEALGHLLGKIDTASKWWIGDWLISGEVQFGELAYQASEALGLAESTRQRYALVAQKVPPPRRRPELSWTHHRYVAAMEPEEQNDWLDAAAESGWSAHDLHAQLREQHAIDPPPRGGLAAAVQNLLAAAEKKRSYYAVPFAVLDAVAEAAS